MEAVFEDVVCPLAMALLPPFFGEVGEETKTSL